jgi:type IV pilus biogenesis protein CpaD/CtpE
MDSRGEHVFASVRIEYILLHVHTAECPRSTDG